MYRYTKIDQATIDTRVRQFRDQTSRYLAGELSEEQFRPLRLQNGLYIQRHAPMLRVAIPYGLLSARQLRALAEIAQTHDRGYGHFTTRQNIQFNWLQLTQVPDILEKLAKVQLHAIQTSGNCIRNTTTDHFAGIAPDENVNALVWCELIRQWSTLHPEFAHLPRKFKIAVSGAQVDRAATYLHDIGLIATTARDGDVGFRVIVGGGMGRTPRIGQVIREFLPWQHLLSYLEAILRVYNLKGRRDNKYKARIKILLQEEGLEPFKKAVEEEWQHLQDGVNTLTRKKINAITKQFTEPKYCKFETKDDFYKTLQKYDKRFGQWVKRNVHPHRVNGYVAVTLSLKATDRAPGDVTADQMQAIARIAERYSQEEIRVTHEQNLLLPHVPKKHLETVWLELIELGLATANVGLITNIIACPGGDFCSLANAKSLPLAKAIQNKFDDLDYQHDIGEIDLNISGCINSCGHHHVGHIGILGVDKQGEEWYQITLGGNQGTNANGINAAVGKIIGPSVKQADVPHFIERLIEAYLDHREGQHERFIETLQRVGVEPFKEYAYAYAVQAD